MHWKASKHQESVINSGPLMLGATAVSKCSEICNYWQYLEVRVQAPHCMWLWSSGRLNKEGYSTSASSGRTSCSFVPYIFKLFYIFNNDRKATNTEQLRLLDSTWGDKSVHVSFQMHPQSGLCISVEESHAWPGENVSNQGQQKGIQIFRAVLRAALML